MLHLIDNSKVYAPQTVAIMTAAFDKVCQSASLVTAGSDEERRVIALAILMHVDYGERDPDRLAELALRELNGGVRKVSRRASAE